MAARSFGTAPTMRPCAPPLSNKVAASWLIVCGDVQHIALADRHYVATLQRGHAPILGRIAPPNVDLPGEVGVEFVNCRREDRLFMPRGPEERIERHAIINPAGRIAGIERVGKRRQQILSDARGIANNLEPFPTDVLRKLLCR